MSTYFHSLNKRLASWSFLILIAISFHSTGAEEATVPTGVGHPDSERLIKLLQSEIVTGLKHRGATSPFIKFKKYSAWQLDTTAQMKRGMCRLDWYEHLFRNPLKAPAEADRFTRALHENVLDGQRGLDRIMITAREKLDLPSRQPAPEYDASSPDEALDIIKRGLDEAHQAYGRAMAPLTRGELQLMQRQIPQVLVTENKMGHTLYDRGVGPQLCLLIEKMNRHELQSGIDALLPVADRDLLQMLTALEEDENISKSIPGVSGRIVRRIETANGDIIIGGPERNVYQLDEMKNVTAVIDLGGDDDYYEGSVSPRRPVMVVADLGGNDNYRGKKQGIQGGAVLGISMLVDVTGNDRYRARDVAQGACIAGAGVLIDYEGNDYYIGFRRAQGSAFGGTALHIDYEGNDHFRAAMWAQGYGGPLGFGLLDNVKGKDYYYAGGHFYDSYPETPGYEGWSQGVGCGSRQVANGGFGIILEGEGDDIYEFDYMSHGGGYWFAVGFARDFAGNDYRVGSTRKLYNGSDRTEPECQRFSSGFGCHYALGFCIDDSGNDAYRGTIMCLGFAWDDSIGMLLDFDGDDRYLATGGGTQGNGAQAGLGVIFDRNGDDRYDGYGQGNADGGISYHKLPECGGNFSFVIDHGGKDTYGCGAENNSYNMRGSYSGFLIDRNLNEVAKKPEDDKKKTAGKDNPEHTAAKPDQSEEETTQQ